ncbi:MAG: PQQ-dependent sugar dehydrogenase [Flavisolibacter sp.]|nr:PQQ-dependent sugar dehydrogenase [Flavisolibacter sp.]
MQHTLLLAGLLSFFSSCLEQTNNSVANETQGSENITTSVLVQHLHYPWEILWGPDHYIWMAERGGRISRVHSSTGAVIPVFTIPDVQSRGEGGLLGMVLHPDFKSNPFVYVGYNYNKSGDYKEKIVRFTYNGTTLTHPLILVDNIEAAGIHNGCRLAIHDYKLFISTGDASDQPSAQNKSLLNGKILRVNLDGTIPSDNPVPNSPVWTFGHRNPQGLVFIGNKLFSSEHGPDTDDEINIIEKGRNYGWPEVKGFCNTNNEKRFCTENNVKEPIYAWTPTAAVSGLDYYNGNELPQWKNSLLVVALKNSRLYQLKLNAAQTEVTAVNEFFTNDYGRMRDVCVAPDGKVYICTSNGGNDKIIVVRSR